VAASAGDTFAKGDTSTFMNKLTTSITERTAYLFFIFVLLTNLDWFLVGNSFRGLSSDDFRFLLLQHMDVTGGILFD
jgi:hypothetical protein